MIILAWIQLDIAALPGNNNNDDNNNNNYNDNGYC